MKNWVYVAAMGLFAVVIAFGAITNDSTVDDRAAALGTRIMCPVCQGESIANSGSETATSMMGKVADLVEQGQSDEQVLDYFKARYGEFIILDPPFAGKTIFVWLLPVVAAGFGIWMIARRRRIPEAPAQQDST